MLILSVVVQDFVTSFDYLKAFELIKFDGFLMFSSIFVVFTILFVLSNCCFLFLDISFSNVNLILLIIRF
jgi:hypothetical protein